MLLFIHIDAEQRAASFAYYALFSVPPLITLIVSVGSSFMNPSDLAHAVDRYFTVGSDTQHLLWQMEKSLHHSRGSFGVVSGLILLWASLRFFQALVRAVNRCWHTVEIPWWQMPLKNVAMLAVIASAVLLGVLVPALLQTARSLTVLIFPQSIDAFVLGTIDTLSFAMGVMIPFYAFSMLYMFAPRQRVYFKDVWFSALVVAIFLQLLQFVFVRYLPFLVHYNTIYGSVGALMFLLLWLYLCGMTIIFGACLSASRPAKQAGSSLHPAAPSAAHP